LSNVENNIVICQENEHLFLLQSMNTFIAKYEKFFDFLFINQ